MLKLLLRIFPAIALPLLAADPVIIPTTGPQLLPTTGTLHSGIQFAGETIGGDFSALMPLHSSVGNSGRLNGSLIFAEPYAQWFERSNVQAGLGLGFRHLFGHQPLATLLQKENTAGFLDEGVYVGAHAFLDMADTHYDQRFWQLGLEAEVGTRYVELRGRYHIPLDNGEESTVRRIDAFHSSYDMNYRGARYEASSTVTVDSLFTYLTESLEGWDIETSLLVPGLDRWVDLRVVGGYARFHSSTFDAIDYDSWKAGVEFRPVPAVILGCTWFENEALVGDHWLFGISLELPFEIADIGDGKGGFWGHIQDAFKPRRRHLMERMVEPVRNHALQMQLGRGLKSIKTKTSYDYQAAWILPDGTVITVVDGKGSFSKAIDALKISNTHPNSSSNGSYGDTFNLIDWAASASFSSSSTFQIRDFSPPPSSTDGSTSDSGADSPATDTP